MAVEAIVDNKIFYPNTLNINVDTTPRDGSDTTGAISTANFSTIKSRDDHLMDKRKEVSLFGDRQDWSGRIRTIEDADHATINYTAVDKLNDLNVQVNLPPFQGTLADALRYYIQYNIKSSAIDLNITTSLANEQVVFPAINGNLWNHIKMLMAAFQLDLRSTGGESVGNLFPDPDFQVPFGTWDSVNKGIEKQGSGGQQGSYFDFHAVPAQPGETFHVSALGELVEGTLSNDNIALSIYARYYPGAGNGTTLSRVLFWRASNINTSQSQFFTLPEGENIEDVRLGFFTESPVPTDARVRISQVQLTRPKQIVVSDIGSEGGGAIELYDYSVTTLNKGIELDQPAERIDCHQYAHVWVENGVLWPEGGWVDDAPVQSLEIGKNEFNLDLDSSVESLTVPMVVDEVTPEYDGNRTVYSIVGDDDIPITAAQWNALGGKLETEIGEDHKTIIVKVFVPPMRNKNAEDMTTVRLAMSSGDGNHYSSLRIVGTGALTTGQELFLPTGLESSDVAASSGQSIDNIFVNTPARAWTLLVNAVDQYTTGRLTLNMATPNRNLKFSNNEIPVPMLPGSIWQDPETKRWHRVRNVQSDLNMATLAMEDFLNIEHYQEAWGSTGEVLLENLARTPQAITSRGFGSNSGIRNPLERDQALPVPHPNPTITRGTYSTLTDPAFTEVLSIFGLDTNLTNDIDVDRYVGCWILIENQNHQAGDWDINLGGGEPTRPLPAGNNTWFWVSRPSAISANGRPVVRVNCRRADFDHTTAKVWITGIVSLEDRVPNPEDFFDGDTAWGDRASYEWTGTPNESSSVKRDHTSWNDIYLKYQGLTHEQIRIEGIKNW